MIRTLREEFFWLQEGTSPYDLIRAFDAWIAYYTNHYFRTALRYKSSRPFEQDYEHSHCFPFVAT
jgi:hypothetical protein